MGISPLPIPPITRAGAGAAGAAGLGIGGGCCEAAFTTISRKHTQTRTRGGTRPEKHPRKYLCAKVPYRQVGQFLLSGQDSLPVRAWSDRRSRGANLACKSLSAKGRGCGRSK